MSSPYSGRRLRAKHACHVCHMRRVRCDVTQAQPCSNCRDSGATCEVLPSRRGRYPRRPRAQGSTSVGSATEMSLASPSMQTRPSPHSEQRQSCDQPEKTQPEVQQQQPHQTATPAPSSSASASAATVFYGESSFLTIVQGAGAQPEEDDAAGPAGANGQREQRGRLLFPLNGGTPHPPEEDGTSPAASVSSQPSAATTRYLRDEGALAVPDFQSCLPALQAYFTWFHPCFPVLDRAEIARRLLPVASASAPTPRSPASPAGKRTPTTAEISPLLLQAILFIGATYCDDATILAMGFRDRSEAKSRLYSHARLLFHADWEKDEITLIQALFLISFWRGDKFDVRDVRYWLGSVITFAMSAGLHRSTRLTTRNPHVARLRRRIWWSIYVRERQSAASLGMPSRIRDEDCDVEMLTAADLESDDEDLCGMPLGKYSPEHITYAIKMVENARLLGKVIDLHFIPSRPPATPQQVASVDAAVQEWEQSLRHDLAGTIEDGSASIWTCLLQLAYNHIRILIHRTAFLRSKDDGNKQVALAAANRVSRIAEDMLTHGNLRYGQMHLLFGALSIHAICIRRSVGIPRRIAEHKAQMCLLALKDIQKYWRINNRVLDLFLQYLDQSIAKRLRGGAGTLEEPQQQLQQQQQVLQVQQQPEECTAAAAVSSDQHSTNPEAAAHQSLDATTADASTRKPHEVFEDQYFDILSSHWESDNLLSDLGLFLDPQLQDDAMQIEGLNLLERAL